MEDQKNVISWIWLQKALGVANPKVRAIHTAYGSARQFYDAGPAEWRLSGLVTAADVHKLCDTDFTQCEKIIDDCQRLHYRILTPDQKEYPDRLLNIDDYPAALYVWGDLGDVDNEILISMVGTRSASPYGREVAGRLSATLAKAGAVIVSGAAYGIDTICHKGALRGGGRTIAVLGCGINTRYLVENEQLRRAISQNGAVISEYPPGTAAAPRNFPIRNRLISGLSLGTVVIEAGVRSGSLITAHRAIEQGRDVFAVPGSVLSEYSAGCNKLLGECAKPVGCAYDVLSEYVDQYPHCIRLDLPEVHEKAHSDMKPWEKDQAEASKPAVAQEAKSRPSQKMASEIKCAEKQSDPPKPDTWQNQASSEPIVREAPLPSSLSLTPEAKKLYQLLDETPQHVDELSHKSGLTSYVVAAAMTELEIAHLVRPHVGRRFSRMVVRSRR
nr:DNA-processing protein DprA [uncultured Solibaculum sp.]